MATRLVTPRLPKRTRPPALKMLEDAYSVRLGELISPILEGVLVNILPLVPPTQAKRAELEPSKGKQ